MSLSTPSSATPHQQTRPTNSTPIQSTLAMTDTTPIAPARRPYTGSCHCGATRYIAYLTLPHTPGHQQSIYRCNCTSCHKSSILHVRLTSSPDDFLLLSPLTPSESLGDYTCGEKQLHYFFCKTCGVRCFTFMGEGEVVDVDLEKVGDKGEEGVVKAWRPKKEGWREGRSKFGCYLSVNGYTLDAGQEGLDLREWKDEGWVGYLDYLREGEDRGAPSFQRPHPGGAY